MRLLVDCHSFDNKISQGVTSYIKGIYSFLPQINKNIQFYFVAADTENIKNVFGERENISYVRLTSKNRIFRLLFEIPEIIKRNNIDIAHFQYVSPLIKNCKTIVTLHDVLFMDYSKYFPFTYRISKNNTFKLSAKRADMLCTVSGYSQHRIAEHYGIDKDKIIITPNAVDDEFYSISGEKPSDFPDRYILYVSRIEPRKNHLCLVKAFMNLKLNEQNYNLVFIGKETVPTPELHNYINNNLSMEEKSSIKFLSQVPFSDLKLWYKYADLFVYPSLAEGFGIPPLEAAAASIPVICNDATAMSDFSFFEKNLIDVSKQDLLEERIIVNLQNRKEICLDSISKKVKEQYNWQTIARYFNKEIKMLFA